MMTSFLGGVLRKLISFHSADINRRKSVSYYVKGLLYCTNICKEIYDIVLHIAMQGDINICKEIYFIVLHVGMQGDINICKEIYVMPPGFKEDPTAVRTFDASSEEAGWL